MMVRGFFCRICGLHDLCVNSFIFMNDLYSIKLAKLVWGNIMDIMPNASHAVNMMLICF